MSEVTPTNARGAMLGAYQLLVHLIVVNMVYLALLTVAVCAWSILLFDRSPDYRHPHSRRISAWSLLTVCFRGVGHPTHHSAGRHDQMPHVQAALGSGDIGGLQLTPSVLPLSDCSSFLNRLGGTSLEARSIRQGNHFCA